VGPAPGPPPSLAPCPAVPAVLPRWLSRGRERPPGEGPALGDGAPAGPVAGWAGGGPAGAGSLWGGVGGGGVREVAVGLSFPARAAAAPTVAWEEEALPGLSEVALFSLFPEWEGGVLILCAAPWQMAR